MTVIRPNSVSGINSITAQANEIKIFKSDGTQGGLVIGGANLNATSGISTVAALTVTGNVSVGGTLTYQDVTNIDSVGVVTARAGVKVPDSQKIFLGTGDDLEIYHDGSNARIRNTTGQLWLQSDNGIRFVDSDVNESTARFTDNGAVELYYDGTKKFETTNAGATVTGTLAADGISLGDSETLNIGAGNDLQIYHDGSHTYANNTTGYFHIRSGSEIRLQKTGGERMIYAIPDGAVELYYDNVKKFETHADGLHIGDGGNLDMPHDSSKIVMGASDDLQIYHDGSHSYVKDAGTGELRLESDAGGVRIQRASGHTGIFYNVGGQVELYYDNNKKLETNTNGIRVTGRVEINGSNGRIEYNNIANTFEFFTGGNKVAEFLSSGHFVPGTNNTYDLGSSSYRWRNIYTNDLNLSNEGSTNDVDGTWGNYTIQEGENDLFLINKRNGKKYKFNLTEVN